jgi:hypothetical protein
MHVLWAASYGEAKNLTSVAPLSGPLIISDKAQGKATAGKVSPKIRRSSRNMDSHIVTQKVFWWLQYFNVEKRLTIRISVLTK